MRKSTLLATTAMIGAGVMSGSASAADGVKLGIGGFFRTRFRGRRQ
jgi:hypothetical protein